jgi:hypothetical protein
VGGTPALDLGAREDKLQTVLTRTVAARQLTGVQGAAQRLGRHARKRHRVSDADVVR